MALRARELVGRVRDGGPLVILVHPQDAPALEGLRDALEEVAMLNPELYSPLVLQRAKRYFPFLLEYAAEDVRQVSGLVRTIEKLGVSSNIRNVCDRELYSLAIALGYKRCSEDGKKRWRWVP